MTRLFFWKMMHKGKIDKDLINAMPETHKEKAKKVIQELEDRYSEIKTHILLEIDNMYKNGVSFGNIKDRDFVDKVNVYLERVKPKYASMFLPLMREKDDVVDRYIKNKLRPVGIKRNTLS